MRLFLLTIALILCCTSVCSAVDVVVVADGKLRPVVDTVSGISKTLRTPLRIYSPAQVRGRLDAVVDEEQAKVVVALGREALTEALRLPTSILVIYDLVVVPPAITRPNTTGFYMATPVREYAEFISSHLHDALSQIAVVGSREQINLLGHGSSSRLSTYTVRNAYDFVNTLRQISSADAILLLPDINMLTATALDEAYLLSFRKKIPLLGFSEKNVKDGALFALVVDPVNVGRMIGEYASRALKGANVGQIPPSPPRKFELYLNLETARKMGIRVPEHLVRIAKRIYP